jgi:hypothetical protein
MDNPPSWHTALDAAAQEAREAAEAEDARFDTELLKHLGFWRRIPPEKRMFWIRALAKAPRPPEEEESDP